MRFWPGKTNAKLTCVIAANGTFSIGTVRSSRTSKPRRKVLLVRDGFSFILIRSVDTASLDFGRGAGGWAEFKMIIENLEALKTWLYETLEPM